MLAITIVLGSSQGWSAPPPCQIRHPTLMPRPPAPARAASTALEACHVLQRCFDALIFDVSGHSHRQRQAPDSHPTQDRPQAPAAKICLRGRGKQSVLPHVPTLVEQLGQASFLGTWYPAAQGIFDAQRHLQADGPGADRERDCGMPTLVEQLGQVSFLGTWYPAAQGIT